MSKFRFLVFALLVVAIAVPLAALAQEPGSGGPIIEGNFSGSANMSSMNPIRCSGTDCRRITDLLFPYVVWGSGDTQTFGRVGEPTVVQSLAADWTVSEDGLTYTFTLRDDAVWSDGEPITSEDVKFSFEAIASEQAEAALYQGTVNGSEANPNGIFEVNIVDDYTVDFVFQNASCAALDVIGYPVIPAHAFGFDGDFEAFDYSVLVGNEFDTNPSVTSGPFEFGSLTSGEAIGLVANTDFVDGTTVPAGFIYRDVPDQTVLVEQLLAGESNFADAPPVNRREDIRNAENLQYFEYPGSAWDYLGFNLADPSNPQNGIDEAGNPIDQGLHPLFGDVTVRRAIQHAINVPDIVEGAVAGEGTQMASSSIPSSAYMDETLEPIGYDPAAAAALLDEAGWVLNADGVRECQGCSTAEDGTLFEFNLMTNAGNTRREAIGVIVQDQLSELGITVNFEALDFNTVLDNMYSQTYDAYILGWRESWPANPDQTQIFTASNDNVENNGSNVNSYYNAELEAVMQEAATVPGCDFDQRKALYSRAQTILQQDQPYVFLFVQNGMYAAAADIEGFDPRANHPLWNSGSWIVPSAE
jgi:peptide/nickel transport system substrate-binding protein